MKASTSGFGPVARDHASATFFEAAASGELLVPQCHECGHFSAYTTQVCTSCGSTSISWSAATGSGTIVSWTALPESREPEAVERVMVLVELDEGPWLETRLLDADRNILQIGSRVAIQFVRPPDSEPFPVALQDESPK